MNSRLTSKRNPQQRRIFQGKHDWVSPLVLVRHQHEALARACRGHVRGEVECGCMRERACVCVRPCVCVRACASACRCLCWPHSAVTALATPCDPERRLVVTLSAVLPALAYSIRVTSWACRSFRAGEISDDIVCQSCQWIVEVSLIQHLGRGVSLFVAEKGCLQNRQIMHHGSSSGYRDKPRLDFLASTLLRLLPRTTPIFIVVSESGHSSFYWISSYLSTNYSPYIKFSANTEMPPRLPYGSKPSTPYFEF